jgi:hypothetical protein
MLLRDNLLQEFPGLTILSSSRINVGLVCSAFAEPAYCVISDRNIALLVRLAFLEFDPRTWKKKVVQYYSCQRISRLSCRMEYITGIKLLFSFLSSGTCNETYDVFFLSFFTSPDISIRVDAYFSCPVLFVSSCHWKMNWENYAPRNELHRKWSSTYYDRWK